ncbi:26S proteasome non-ATPase regulatory subunit [Spraguea lophii 42_110]|uniref:26S proteasome non-ATPase regulatory subunit n=1 Tax=Spraguea lophii (strain 42_110) TaxID=1358809 RepID=S7XS13_SPRLO|nr:26S proteasome non-ATPase regulatory subunit [Spraguea lophii 42_110]
MELDFKQPSLSLISLVLHSKKKKEDFELVKYISDNEMAPLYMYLVQNKILPFDNEFYEKLKMKNKKKIEILESKKLDSIESEKYLQDIEKAIAEYYACIGDYTNFKDVVTNMDISNLSLKMDILLCEIRMGLIYKNKSATNNAIAEATKISEMCDWDRRNKFKVYDGLLKMIKGRYREAADLFLEVLPTFQSQELLSYQEVVVFALFSSLLAYDRNELYSKILNGSHILEAGEDIQSGYLLVESLYNCAYEQIFYNLIQFSELCRKNIFLAKKVHNFINQIKIRAYQQLLHSYSSINLQSMADIFQISLGYLENDLTRFIVDQKLFCSIDRTEMVVYVKDSKIELFEKIAEKGEKLLTFIEKSLNE